MKELRQEGKMGQIPDYSPTMKPEFPILTTTHASQIGSEAHPNFSEMRNGRAIFVS